MDLTGLFVNLQTQRAILPRPRRVRKSLKFHGSLQCQYRKESEEDGSVRKDEVFMRAALLEAKEAARIGEVPVGAVLVHAGGIISRAHNRVEMDRDPTAHAELLCIRKACRKLGKWRLTETTMYITLEPCPMCAGAILQARISELVWGAPNTLLGADGSWVDLFDVKSPERTCRNHPFNPNIRVRRGVLGDDCAQLMKSFFREQRTRKEKLRPGPQEESMLIRTMNFLKRHLFLE